MSYPALRKDAVGGFKMRAAFLALAVACATGLALISVPDASEARTAFPARGGTGDASAPDECPKGWYVIGFKGRAGAWIDQLALKCARFYANNTIAETRLLPARGGQGGGAMEMDCPRGSVVQEVRPLMTPDRRMVRQFRFVCASLSGNQISTIHFSADGLNWGLDFDRDPDVEERSDWMLARQNCPAGDSAVGMRINHGKHVNAIGLICDEAGLRAPPPPTPRKPMVSTGRREGGPATGPVPPDGFCRSYANIMTQHALEARKIGCAVDWNTDQKLNFDKCMIASTLGNIPSGDVGKIKAEIAKCKAGSAEPAAPAAPAVKLTTASTCEVKKDGAVYDAPGSGTKKIGELPQKTQGVTLVRKDGANWFLLKWPAGEGWVYSGPGYADALKC